MSELAGNDLWLPDAAQSLDDRRPRFLADIVGQEHVVPRIRQGLLNGQLPQLMALIGPSGVGKTTLAQAMARAHFCPKSHLLGDCCGECKTCRSADLGSYQEYNEWTGAELEEEWRWWVGDGKYALERPGWLFVLDEGQDLSASSKGRVAET